MKYKFCNYLIATTDVDGNIIIYNTLFHNTVCVKKSEREIFLDLRKQILNKGDYSGTSENLQQLLEQKIILPDDDTTIKNILEKRYDEIFKSYDELNLTLLPTQQCNFRCVYCYEDFKNVKMDEITVKKICDFVDRMLVQYKSLHLSWFGGEPLLTLDLIESISNKIFEICKKHKKPYYASITSNGYLLDLNTFKRLQKYHVVQYQITLDGDKNTHNRQRKLIGGKETYDVILNNLLNIKKYITTSTIKIIVRVNLSNQVDINELQQLIDLFSDDDRFNINIQKIFATNVNKETDFETYLSVLKSCDLHQIDKLVPDETICYAAKNNTLIICSDGSLGKCTVNFDDPKNQFGNIKDLDLDTFSFESIKYYNSIHSKENCLNCCLYPLCFGTQCPARKIQLCDELIKKYELIIRNYASKSKSKFISLK